MGMFVAPRSGFVQIWAPPHPSRSLGLVVLLCTCIVSNRVPDPGLLSAGGPPVVLCSEEAPSPGVERLRHFPRLHCEVAPVVFALHRGSDRVEGWSRNRADSQRICLGRVRGGEGSDAVSSVVEDDDDDEDEEPASRHAGVSDVNATDSFESSAWVRKAKMV